MFDIIFFAAIAVFLGFRLYNALGHKNFEPGNMATAAVGDKKVIEASYVEIKPNDYDAKLEEVFGKKLADRIREVRKYDPSFTVENFLNGAKKAFEMIVKAFSAGDKNVLQSLLSKEVYKYFVDEVDKRQNSDTVIETTLVAILSSSIKDIVLVKKYARIGVQIVSEQVNVVRDKQGKIVEGNPSQVDKVEEVWTFGRDLASVNPNWELLETAAA